MERITSVQNTRIKQWAKLHARKDREGTGRFLLEGMHLVEEACRSDIPLEAILVEEETRLPEWLNAYQQTYPNVELFWVTRPVLEKVAETKTPQGMLAIAKMRVTLPDVLADDCLLLVLDKLQDPGNVGTLIRTADAAGFDGVVIGEGSADLYNSKTIRSTMGSLFHLPVWRENVIDFIHRMKSEHPDLRVIGTNLKESKAYTDVMYTGPVALVIGNEGSGISEDVLELTDQNVIIPIHGRAESLNAAIAGSILMYEAIRQRAK
ncbi:TrmH family RNA methyltransferase [Aneurinibacillus aneurinilyticus]|uniref:RNA methyltransferase, TrmH family n=1 Tax=Aneurinibacillus aneurinilyticus ATCC 12856 TaxID=649747 RepID=U1X4Y2_ANEAE|nr:RNA methyltransferase [Aneurinibacillus aneurinilyticus]ERI09598.1 RNA methyltransferase, TrmH family [Aneurinibacillus aneurinilyticus ATCC 12856]MED0706966.1 RNA methyltransferase [Aneurinibacillus aneurinilyticus]MED0725051.1 RNA methyltransferase [Aneurinibacillus aneurinilyticus]MED0733676.1 RNA methyltransferase [Aneurinibacillus aneurinilyticus]MED0739260.1 RNA methyltransferase [Aneurinibacillus aneurinilyticus]